MRKKVILVYADHHELICLRAKVQGLPWVSVTEEIPFGGALCPQNASVMLTWCSDLPSALSIKRRLELVEHASVLLFCPHPQLRMMRLMQNPHFLVLGASASLEMVGSAILSLYRDARLAENACESAVLLTCREQQVVDLLVSGQCNKEIAQQLGIKSSTVLAHKKHLFMKVGVHSTQELVVWALLRHLA